MQNSKPFLFERRRWRKRREKGRENMQKPLHISVNTHVSAQKKGWEEKALNQTEFVSQRGNWDLG